MSKRRDAIKEVEASQLDGQNAGEVSPPDYQQLFRQLVARANGGDPEALKRLKCFLDKNPQIWQQAGNLAAIAERSWIELIAGSNQLIAESAKRQINQLKRDLAGESPTAIEKVLVDHLAACFLAVQHAEIQAASPAGWLSGTGSFRLKRAESGQKRLLQATKTLAILRALVPRGLVPANPLRLHAQGEETA